MGINETLQAAQLLHERGSKKHLRELERQAKQQAKLSAIELARLQVQTHESRLEVLLSVHKEQSETWDWGAFAASLPPPSPARFSLREFTAKQIAELRDLTDGQAATNLQDAPAFDENEYQTALEDYSKENAEREKMRSLALRILAGEHKAYTEALAEFSALAEISELGSAIHFTVHNAKLLECHLKVNGRQAIPAEAKSLTASGKLSIKPMPKTRFHEIYQDYVCGCVLRVAREVFALLPIETALITASVETVDSSTGRPVERPVLSVAIPRIVLATLDFNALDPSDAIENFLHHGDVMVSRRSGEFEAILPIRVADLPTSITEVKSIDELLAITRNLREEIKSEIRNLSIQATVNSAQTPI